MAFIFSIIGWAIILGFAVGLFCGAVMAVVTAFAWLLGWQDE